MKFEPLLLQSFHLISASNLVPPSFENVDLDDFAAYHEEFYDNPGDELTEETHLFGLKHFLDNFDHLLPEQRQILYYHLNVVKEKYEENSFMEDEQGGNRSVMRAFHHNFLSSLLGELEDRICAKLCSQAIALLEQPNEDAKNINLESILADYDLLPAPDAGRTLLMELADLSLIEVVRHWGMHAASMSTYDEEFAASIQGVVDSIKDESLREAFGYYVSSCSELISHIQSIKQGKTNVFGEFASAFAKAASEVSGLSSLGVLSSLISDDNVILLLPEELAMKINQTLEELQETVLSGLVENVHMYHYDHHRKGYADIYRTLGYFDKVLSSARENIENELNCSSTRPFSHYRENLSRLVQHLKHLYESSENILSFVRYVNSLGALGSIIKSREVQMCRFIPASLLLNWDDEIALLSDFSPECLALMPGFSGPEAVDLGPIVPKLNSGAFSISYRFLHSGTIAAMTREQIENFGVKDIDESGNSFCSSGVFIPFFHPTEQVPFLPKECLRDFLSSNFLHIFELSDNGHESVLNTVLCQSLDILDILSQFEEEDFHLISKIPNTCLSSMVGFAGIRREDFSQYVPHLHPEIFTSVFGKLHSNVLKAVTLEQAKTFCESSPDVCSSHKMSEVTGEILQAIPTSCLQYAIFASPDLSMRLSIDHILSLFEKIGSNVFSLIPSSVLYTKFSVVAIQQEMEKNQQRIVPFLLSQASLDLEKNQRSSVCANLSIADVASAGLLEKLNSQCIRVMKGVFARPDAEAINLAPYFSSLNNLFFRSLLPGLHEDTLKALTPTIAVNFGIANPVLCSFYDLSVLPSDAIREVNGSCLVNSMKSYPQLPFNISPDDLVAIFDRIRRKLTFEVIHSIFNDEIFSKLPAEKVFLLNGVWELHNISSIKHLITPDIIRFANIVPTKDLIELVGDDLASHWAANKGYVCFLTLREFSLEYVTKLSLPCQAFLFSANKDRFQVNLATVTEEFLLELLKANYFALPDISHLLEIPLPLRKHISPEIFQQGNFDSFESLLDLEGFREDIMSMVATPLNPKTIQSLDEKYFSIRLCHFHFEEELPEYAKTSECLRSARMLKKYFPESSSKQTFFAFLSFVLHRFFLSNDDSYNRACRRVEDILSRHLPLKFNEQREFWIFLREVVAMYGPRSEVDIAIELRFLRSHRFFLTAQLLVNTENDVLSLFAIDGGYRADIRLGDHNLGGTIYPSFLFSLIVENAKYFAAASRTKVFKNMGIDSHGLSRNLVEQCLGMILDGPDKKLAMIEKGENFNEEQEDAEENVRIKGVYHEDMKMNTKPMLKKLDYNSKHLFFPFRASRTTARFVAFTIVKAIQEKLAPSIDLGHEFYVMASRAVPEDEMTDELKDVFRSYHDRMYYGRGKCPSLPHVLSVLEDYIDDDYFLNYVFPDPTVFNMPLSIRTGNQPLPLPDSGVPQGYVRFQDRPDFLNYIRHYEELTHAEFRGLLLEFKDVLGERIGAVVNLWNPILWQNIVRETTITAEELIAALKPNDSLMDSLVKNKLTGEIYQISILEAIRLFLLKLNQRHLPSFLTMFSGSKRMQLGLHIFEINITEADPKKKVSVHGDGAFGVIGRPETETLILDIFRAQWELFGLEEDMSELVVSDHFYSINAHTCFLKIDVFGPLNNYSLIHALIQQLNSSPDYLEEH